jgi:tryptophanase
MQVKTIIEPFRIKTVEPIRQTTEAERATAIRAAAIGSVMCGRQPDGTEKSTDVELVRLAFPRRVYRQRHMDYVAEVLLHVNTIAARIRGVRITEQPAALRHFTAKFAPVSAGRLVV